MTKVNPVQNCAGARKSELAKKVWRKRDWRLQISVGRHPKSVNCRRNGDFCRRFDGGHNLRRKVPSRKVIGSAEGRQAAIAGLRSEVFPLRNPLVVQPVPGKAPS